MAHAHHNITEIDTSVPFDGIIWTHVCSSSPTALLLKEVGGGTMANGQMSLQTFVWSISFPIGMVLGLSK